MPTRQRRKTRTSFGSTIPANRVSFGQPSPRNSLAPSRWAQVLGGFPEDGGGQGATGRDNLRNTITKECSRRLSLEESGVLYTVKVAVGFPLVYVISSDCVASCIMCNFV